MTATPRTTQYDELDPHSMRRVIDELLARSSGGVNTTTFTFFDDFVNGNAISFPAGTAVSGSPWLATVDKGANAKMTGDVDGNGWATLSLPSNDGDFTAKIETSNLLFGTDLAMQFETRIAVAGINGITTAFYGFSNNIHFTLAGSYELLATDDEDNHSTGVILDPSTAYKLAIDATDLGAVKFYCDDELIYTTTTNGSGQFCGLRLLHSKAASIAGVQQSWIDYVLASCNRVAFLAD